jgi:hypothetical protein
MKNETILRSALAEFSQEIQNGNNEETEKLKEIVMKYKDIPEFKELAATLLLINSEEYKNFFIDNPEI